MVWWSCLPCLRPKSSGPQEDHDAGSNAQSNGDNTAKAEEAPQVASGPPPAAAEPLQQRMDDAPTLIDANDQPDVQPTDAHGSEVEVHEAADSVGNLPDKQPSRHIQFGDPVTNTFTPDPKPLEEAREHSHLLLQKSLPMIPVNNVDLETRAAGLKHIGFGPLKKENQDEYFVQVGGYGGRMRGSCYCIFDGHGSYGRDAAAFCRQELPVLFDQELRRYYQQAAENGVRNPNERELIEPIISDAFVETERRLRQAGVNVSSSGTTASVVYQHGSSLWVAAVGDSRVVCLSSDGSNCVVQPLTLDHRPARRTEKNRVEAAGGRVEPKRLPSGKTVGEPRLWLGHLPSPGLLLSRSIGDEMASSVGCTSRPEVTFLALRPYLDQHIVIASDGVWDVLSNEQVAQLVSSAEDPEAACQQVLDAALLEWEERLAADNISVIVVQLLWGDMHPSSHSSAESASMRRLMAAAAAAAAAGNGLAGVVTAGSVAAGSPRVSRNSIQRSLPSNSASPRA